LDVTVDIGRIRRQARVLSKSLLGGQFRAEVAAYIGTADPPFWARGMAKQLDIPENKVAAELSRFADRNLLVEMSGAGWDRRTLYERAAESASYWAAGAQLLRRAAADEALRVGIDTDLAVASYVTAVHGQLPAARAIKGEP
jgi:hypothetical protein